MDFTWVYQFFSCLLHYIQKRAGPSRAGQGWPQGQEGQALPMDSVIHVLGTRWIKVNTPSWTHILTMSSVHRRQMRRSQRGRMRLERSEKLKMWGRTSTSLGCAFNRI